MVTTALQSLEIIGNKKLSETTITVLKNFYPKLLVVLVYWSGLDDLQEEGMGILFDAVHMLIPKLDPLTRHDLISRFFTLLLNNSVSPVFRSEIAGAIWEIFQIASESDQEVYFKNIVSFTEQAEPTVRDLAARLLANIVSKYQKFTLDPLLSVYWSGERS